MTLAAGNEVPTGQFFGTVRASRCFPPILCSETTYRPRMEVPRHVHGESLLVLVLRGSFEEREPVTTEPVTVTDELETVTVEPVAVAEEMEPATTVLVLSDKPEAVSALAALEAWDRQTPVPRLQEEWTAEREDAEAPELEAAAETEVLRTRRNHVVGNDTEP